MITRIQKLSTLSIFFYLLILQISSTESRNIHLTCANITDCPENSLCLQNTCQCISGYTLNSSTLTCDIYRLTQSSPIPSSEVRIVGQNPTSKATNWVLLGTVVFFAISIGSVALYAFIELRGKNKEQEEVKKNEKKEFPRQMLDCNYRAQNHFPVMGIYPQCNQMFHQGF